MMSVQSKIEEKIKSCKDYSKPENGLPPPNLEYLSTSKMILVTNTKVQ